MLLSSHSKCMNCLFASKIDTKQMCQNRINDSYSYQFGIVFVCLFFLFFHDRVSLYIPGCPETHILDQASLQIRSLPASASRVLGLKVCATTPWQGIVFMCTRNYPCYS